MADQNKITWEDHDEGYDGWYQSACGRFEVQMDPVYGYHTLHHADDPCESLGESRDLSELTRLAEWLVAQGKARAA